MNNAHRQSGFTLLELIVVLTLITVMLAVTTPQLAGRSQIAALRSAGYDVQTMAAAARARAVLRGNVLELVLDDNGKQLRLINPAETYDDTNDNDGVDILPRRRFPTSIQVHFNHQSEDDTAPDRIRFRPDGSADGGELRIVNEQGDELILRLVTPLGRLEIVESA